MIYIMAHNKVNFNNFYVDKSFDKEIYLVFLTSGKRGHNQTSLIEKIKNEGLGMTLEWELENYNKNLQLNTFHAPSIFYNTHVSGFEFKNDYVGFLEYDLSLYDGFTDKVKDIVNKHKGERFLIFPSHRHKLETLNKSTSITTQGTHWLEYFIKDYNNRFGTEYKRKEFVTKHKEEIIPTQQSFICDVITYKELSKYVYDIITKAGINQKKYAPRPSTNLERFIGMFLFLHSLKYGNTYSLPLTHHHSSDGKY